MHVPTLASTQQEADTRIILPTLCSVQNEGVDRVGIHANDTVHPTKNQEQEIGQPWRKPLETGNLLEILGYKITQLFMSLEKNDNFMN